MLEHLEPKPVFHFFEQICGIPHGSGNISQISDYLVRFAKERGLYCRQDEVGNVILIKEASEGMEDREPVIIQGHMDMVAVKEKDCAKDMATEGLDLAVDGDFVYAKGTSLGADDGIAVAYALALLDSEESRLPRLEVIVTVDEEVGMDGAQAIELTELKGHTLLNIDSEKEGELTTACAGGMSINASWQVDWDEAEGEKYRLTLRGLRGGHSGVEIDKGGANANKLMMEILYLLEREFDISLLSMEGGTKDNVIPSSAVAEIYSRATQEELAGLVEVMETSLREEWRTTDANLSLTVEKMEKKEEKGMDTGDFYRLLSFFMEVPNGVQAMSEALPQLVETSLNFGTVKLENQGEMRATFSLRSSVTQAKKALAKKVTSQIVTSAGNYEKSGEYPSWEYREISPLRDKMVAVYQEMFHKEPKILSIHAGLECGILSQKIDNLDCVSFGPDIFDIHTTAEKLSISSVQRVWEYLLAVIA